MSSHIHSLKVGDELAFKGPIPKFAYKANQFESISLVAGGSGITPMYQLLQEIDSNPQDKTKATLSSFKCFHCSWKSLPQTDDDDDDDDDDMNIAIQSLEM